jgi:hypothetical protein
MVLGLGCTDKKIDLALALRSSGFHCEDFAAFVPEWFEEVGVKDHRTAVLPLNSIRMAWADEKLVLT